MSLPRPAPIYAWGEKLGPSRIEEEEEDRRPPEEEEVEETVPVPVPTTSVPTGEEAPNECREKGLSGIRGWGHRSAPSPDEAPQSSARLWRTLVSFHYNAVGALNQLLTRLLGDPQEPPASEEEAFALGLVAAQVLAELLRKPPGAFSATLHNRWSVAWITVVLWVSRLHSHQASHGATARQPPQSSPPPRCGWPAIPHKVSWELLTDAETFLDGVSLLTRAMQEWLFADHLQMASFVVAVLDGPDRHPYPGTALTIRVELLRHPSTHPLADRALAHLRRHLTSSDAALHSLALDGLLHMAESPKKVRNPRASLLEAMHKLLPLLPEVLSSLQEADHPKAQSLLDNLHVLLQIETSPPVAAEVASHMPLLLDAAIGGLLGLIDLQRPGTSSLQNTTGVPEYVRIFACTTFQAMLERGAERDLHHLALRSLVPVLLHLRDDSPTVVEPSTCPCPGITFQPGGPAPVISQPLSLAPSLASALILGALHWPDLCP
ncbi:UNVERIFIED_CONTAM: hypothetical protein K2H54_006227 [Gekko kuhli]